MADSERTARYKAAGKYLKMLREARGITIKDMAVRIGLEATTSQMISMIESGRVPLPRDKWYPASKALGATDIPFVELMMKWYIPDLHVILFDQFGVPKSIPESRKGRADETA